MSEYPHMLYENGDTAGKYRIVTDAQAEQAAGAEGFVRAGQKPEKPAADPQPEPADKPRRRGRQ